MKLSKKSSPILDYERWARSRFRFLGSQPTGDLVINPVVGCRYFPPGPRLLSQPKRSLPWPLPNYTAWWQRHTGVSSLHKATMQWCPATTRTRDQCWVWYCETVSWYRCWYFYRKSIMILILDTLSKKYRDTDTFYTYHDNWYFVDTFDAIKISRNNNTGKLT